MSTKANFGNTKTPTGTNIVATYDSAKTAAFMSDWISFTNCTVVAQVSGTASSLTAVIERSDLDPGQFAGRQVNAGTTEFSGVDPATGVAPVLYVEPGQGWWRWNVSAVSGGNVNTSLGAIGGA